MPTALLIVLGGYCLLNLYLFVRMTMMLNGYPWLQASACLIVVTLFAAFPLGRLFESKPSPLAALADPLIIVGSIAIAPLLYAFLLTFATDLFRLVCRMAGWFPQWATSTIPHIRLYTCVGIILLTLLICIVGAVLAASPVVREIELNISVPSATLAQNGSRKRLTIAALSDIHMGRLISADRLAQLMALIQPRNPDMVLFLGDTIDDLSGLDKPRIGSILRSIDAPLGVWGIEGNHEYYAGLTASMDLLKSSGMKILADQWAAPGNAVLLIGRHDATRQHQGSSRLSVDEILAQVPAEQRKLPIILMDHQPVEPERAAQAGVALELSGHTHKGQLFPFNFFVGAMFKHLYGHHQIDQTHYWVSSGAGTWGPPIRTTGRGEVLLITLNFVAWEE